jgi:hypothetical protein
MKPADTDLFKGRHFDQEVIILCVRWYLGYKLSSRDLVEMMGERGIELAHTTILRWVQRYVPEFEKRWSRYARSVGGSWRCDETYIKVNGRWTYLYRAVDKQGRTVDFRLSERALFTIRASETSLRAREGVQNLLDLAFPCVAAPRRRSLIAHFVALFRTRKTAVRPGERACSQRRRFRSNGFLVNAFLHRLRRGARDREGRSLGCCLKRRSDTDKLPDACGDVLLRSATAPILAIEQTRGS